MSLVSTSNKNPSRVFLDEEGCLLEVLRGDKFHLYEVKNSGESTLLVSSQSQYQGEEPVLNHLEVLSSEVLGEVEILTNNYDVSQVIDGLVYVKNFTSLQEYRVEQFSMDMFNYLENYTDALRQLFGFSKDEEYYNRASSWSNFIDEWFINSSQDQFNSSKDLVLKRFDQEIGFLRSYQNIQ